MALEDTAGGLPTDDTQIKATMPKTGGLSLAGQKGVSLNPADSTEIRDRLMQMIAQREQAASGWAPIMEQAAVAAGGPGTFAQNLQAYNTNQRAKENELFNMRVGLAQLNTEEQRIKQAQMQQAENSWNFTNAVRQEQGLPPLPRPSILGGEAPTPQGAPVGAVPAPQGAPVGAPTGAAPAPQGAPMGAAPAPQGAPMGAAPVQRPSNISPTQGAVLAQMFANPATQLEAQKQYLAMTKKDDIERRLESAGIVRGSPQWNQIMALNVAGAGAFTPHDVRGVGGTSQQTPFSAVSSALGASPAPAAAPAPQPNAGALPVAGAAPAPAVAPVPARPPAPVAAAPAPTQGSPFAPGTKEDLEWRQKQAGVPIAGATKESEKLAETFAAEQTALRAAVEIAPSNMALASAVSEDVKKYPQLFAKLNQPTVGSALAGLMKSGIQIGQFGSVSVPGITDFLQQVDPEAKKNPKQLEAWTRIVGNMAKINLDYAQRVMKGQGAVSNYERDLVQTAVGDMSKDSARNMLTKMKLLELESYNAREKNKLWEDAQKRNLSWEQYRKSPEYKDMERAQFFRTAKALKIPNPQFPGDE